MLLEAATSKFSMFITLTLEVDADGPYSTYLDKPTIKRFFKRLRKSFPSGTVRYFIVGEYGEKKGRAHYHALLFSQVYVSEDVVRKAWGLGHVDFGDVQQESIDYCLAYCLKSSNANVDLSEEELLRRKTRPEFHFQSQGLGRAALPHLVVPERTTGELLLNREFIVLGRRWPIGRYLRTKWRAGKTISDLRNDGISDPVRERESVVIERLLHEKLRALSPDSEDYANTKKEIIERKEKELKRLQGRRIADYYRALHHHVKGTRQNEAF